VSAPVVAVSDLRIELAGSGDDIVAEIDLHVSARPDYARRPPAWRHVDGGVECAGNVEPCAMEM